MRTVEVFRAYDNGVLRQVGLSADQVQTLCPESLGPDWTLGSAVEFVAEATGVVITWPSARSSPLAPRP